MRGGKKTGKVLVIPATRNVQAKASASRPLTRLSRLSAILPSMAEYGRFVAAFGASVDSVRRRP
jgi:hypothetical protein